MAITTAFVTGASGFIGGHLVERLVREGWEVRCLVRPSSQLLHQLPAGAVPVTGTLEDSATYQEALTGCDAVFHLGGLVGAPRKADLFRVNGTATGLLADGCAAQPVPPRLIFVSSLAAAGPPPVDRAFRDEADAPAPVSDYGRSKRAGEVALQQRADRLPVTILRPGIVYGPRDPKMAAIFQAIARTGIHFTIGFQTPRLSLIHVDELVDVAIAAAERGETLAHDPAGGYSPPGYYLACDDRVHPSYGQLGRLVARSLGRKVFVWPIWRWVGRTVGLTAQSLFPPNGKGNLLSLDKVREATAWSWACSGHKARTDLGLSPRFALEDRLQELAGWLREHDWL
jgi:nucleoside-diphosphate-sugar epimerase